MVTIVAILSIFIMDNMLHLLTRGTTGFTLRHWSIDTILPGFGTLMSLHRQDFLPLPRCNYRFRPL